ncbi:mitochondrial outer membrane protein porin 3 isoform X2 [Capsicum annuum]|uniref:mitochondrial outer membrane protein porin 3 isoform X2 n=2 Tax=Capsicum annuum TaxID=4072 RepID=UPI001FB0BEB4|nr:mitochondrial outer membrane protein porin 3 isoform X2 [Capsicum annuum]
MCSPCSKLNLSREVQQHQLQLLKPINGVGNLGKVQKSLADLEVLHSTGSGANLFIPTVVCRNSQNKVLSSSGWKKGILFLDDVNAQLRNKNITTDIKLDSSSNLFTTTILDEASPGLKTILSFRVLDQWSGKVNNSTIYLSNIDIERRKYVALSVMQITAQAMQVQSHVWLL